MTTTTQQWRVLFRLPFPCTEKAAAGSGLAAAFRASGGVVGVVLRVAEFDCVLQLVDPRVGEVRDLRDRQQVIAAECGSAIPGGAAAEQAGDVDAVEHAFVRGGVLPEVLSSSVGAWQTWPMKRDTLSYHGYRFPPDIISHAVWLYHRFGVSFRDVEDLLAQRGITVSYEAIRLWCLTFGSVYARRLKRRQGRLGTVKLSRICPFCGRILLDQRLIINDLAVAAGGENAAKLLNLTVPKRESEPGFGRCGC